MIGCIDCIGEVVFRSEKNKMGRTTRSSKTEQFLCLETAMDPVRRVKKSKNKPSEVNAESNLLDLEGLNVPSSAPVFDENEAVDDPNDNSLEYDDERGDLYSMLVRTAWVRLSRKMIIFAKCICF